MALPLILPMGFIAVYGTGTTISASGVSNTTPDGILRWGNIYNVWAGGETYIYGGDNVMFKETDVTVRLASGSAVYTILPARLVTKEELAP